MKKSLLFFFFLNFSKFFGAFRDQSRFLFSLFRIFILLDFSYKFFFHKKDSCESFISSKSIEQNQLSLETCFVESFKHFCKLLWSFGSLVNEETEASTRVMKHESPKLRMLGCWDDPTVLESLLYRILPCDTFHTTQRPGCAPRT